MATRDEKRMLLQAQLDAKIRWGTGESEAREWLRSRHGVAGADADRLLREARRKRVAGIRTRAVIMVLASGCGILIATGFFLAQFFTRQLWIKSSMAAAVVMMFSVRAFIRNLPSLVSGQTTGPVDVP